MRPLPFAPCSEAQLEQLCEQLYTDALAVVKQAALYVLAEEEEEREEPPGGCSLIQTMVGTCTRWRLTWDIQRWAERRCLHAHRILFSWQLVLRRDPSTAACPCCSCPSLLRHCSLGAAATRAAACPPTPAAPMELSLVVCDDAHITELNREWRGVDGPTDVLSFELEDDEDETGCKPEVGCWCVWGWLHAHSPAGCAAVSCMCIHPTLPCSSWHAGQQHEVTPCKPSFLLYPAPRVLPCSCR